MKLNVRRTILVGLAFMTISGFWQMYDFVIPYILKDVFAVSDGISGIVMSLDNVLALLLLPLFGSISDKTDTKFGKRMPYIVVGTILTTVAMMFIPVATNMKSIVFFAIGLGAVLLSIAIYRSPAVALMPDVTIKPLRSKGNAIINLLGAVGGVLVLSMISFLSPSKTGSYMPLFGAVAAFMLIAVIVMALTVKENKWRSEAAEQAKHLVHTESVVSSEEKNVEMKPEVKRSLMAILFAIAFWFMGYNAVISAFSRYAIFQIGMTTNAATTTLQIANIAGIIAFIPIGAFSSKIGRKRTIQIGVVTLFVSFATAALYQSFSPLMYVNFALAGFGWAAINVNSLPMVLEMAKGTDTGKFTGLYYTFSMAAQVITPILSGFLFDIFDYRILFPYAAVFVMLSLGAMCFVKHGDSKLSDYRQVFEDAE